MHLSSFPSPRPGQVRVENTGGRAGRQAGVVIILVIILVLLLGFFLQLCRKEEELILWVSGWW